MLYSSGMKPKNPPPTPNQGIELAITLFDSSCARLAAALGVSSPAITEWRKGAGRVPPKRCVQIEQLTGGAVTRAQLRPDDWFELWPELSGTQPRQAARSRAARAARERKEAADVR